jgi:hypothetical protein
MAKRKAQKDKQGSTKHTHKTKDRVTRTPLKTGGELKNKLGIANCKTRPHFLPLNYSSYHDMQNNLSQFQ